MRAPVSGFVATIAAGNGAVVEAGDALCTLRNPELQMRRVRMASELDAELVSLDAIELEDTTQAAMHRARLAYLRASVEEIDKRLAAMSLVANVAGTVASGTDMDLTGKFLQQGEGLFQIQAGHRFIRIVLTEQAVARARLEIGAEADVRWTCAPAQPVRAVVREIRTAASRYEVPAALTMLGGGEVFVCPAARGRFGADGCAGRWPDGARAAAGPRGAARPVATAPRAVVHQRLAHVVARGAPVPRGRRPHGLANRRGTIFSQPELWLHDAGRPYSPRLLPIPAPNKSNP
ncbi:MAG: hypothetical protein ABIP94_00695 [Planctomycetota bacterium]